MNDVMLGETGFPVGLYEKGLPAEWSWERRLAVAREIGYDFAEICMDESDGRLARLDPSNSAMSELKRAVAATGVPILTMCLSGHRKYSMGSKSAEVRERGLQIMRQAIDFAGEVGVRIVQVAGYDVYYEPSDAETAALYLEGLRRAAGWAAQAGVMLALENVDVPVSESIERCMAIVRQVNSPWFQIYPDMANAAAAGYDPVTELRHCVDRLVAIHVKDGLSRTIRGVPFGDGIVPFEPVFDVLAGLSFRGPFVVEMWADRDRTGDPVAAAGAARVFVAKQIVRAYGASKDAMPDGE